MLCLSILASLCRAGLGETVWIRDGQAGLTPETAASQRRFLKKNGAKAEHWTDGGNKVKMTYGEDLNKSQKKTTLPFNKTCQVHLWQLRHNLGTVSCVHCGF